jgi:glycosyltransferase involved in cell wall biosynthesis
MAQPFLSVIIPAYNEAERIPLTLVDIDKHLSKAEYSYEILVVNDGSKDKTAEVVRSMEKMIKNLKLVDNPENKGKGGVVRQGMLLAKGRVRLFTDADNSTSIDQFNNMLPYFSTGGIRPFISPDDERKQDLGGQRSYDVVIGSRAMKGSKLDPAEPLYRQIPGKIGNIVFQVVLGLWGLWDTQCGFKAFTDDAAEKVFQLSKITGWGFDVEVLTLAKKMGYRIKEIPVHWVNDTRSKVKASAYLKVLWETAKIRWWLWTNKYGSIAR